MRARHRAFSELSAWAGRAGEFAEMASAAGARALVQDDGLTLFSVSAPGLNEVGYSADGIACASQR